jgi:parallel beta-helix repeat protein
MEFASNTVLVEHTGNGEANQYFLTWPTSTFSIFESLSLLENNFYPIHTSVACHSGAFEKERDCLAETFLLNPYGGASACMFNSRFGFTSSTDAKKYSGEIIEQQFRYIFQTSTENLGKIYQYSKDYFASDAMFDHAYRWCLYTLNLLGDPEMPVLQTREGAINSTMYFVDDDYNSDTIGWKESHFNTIQEAINKAENWDTIYVNSGIYTSHILIDKTIEIIGENKYTTILDKGSIRVAANRVKIQHLTITNYNQSLNENRIIIANSNYVTLSDCIISENSIGIYISDSRNIFIIGNTFKQNSKSIYTTVKTGDIYINRNTFFLSDANSYGIYALADGRLVVHNNTFSSYLNFNNFTCAIYSEQDSEIVTNRIKGCSIGIWLENGEHIVENNKISDNKHLGIYCTSSSLDLLYNTIQHNGNNFISYTNDIQPGGIIINGSAGTCLISSNSICGNAGYGIYITNLKGLQNTIEKNDFINNSIPASFKNSFVRWQNNYWEKSRFFPKVIIGFYQSKHFIPLPIIQIDLRPSQTAFN